MQSALTPVSRNLVISTAIGLFLVAALFGSINSTICMCCVAPLAGLLVGYLSGRYQQPENDSWAGRVGLQAGALAGAGALLGSVVGTIIGAALLGPEGSQQLINELVRQMGGTMPDLGANVYQYYATAISCAACIGLLTVGLTAAFGLVGARMWFSRSPYAGPAPEHPLRSG